MSIKNVLADDFLASLNSEELANLERLGEEGVRAHLILLFSTQEKKSSHAAINIPFELGEQKFEAVGFLSDGETSCLGSEAIKRCDNGSLLKSEEDWNFLCNHSGELPAELRSHWLVTARPRPGGPRRVSSLGWDSREWYVSWRGLARQWYSYGLVVRRCVS